MAFSLGIAQNFGGPYQLIILRRYGTYPGYSDRSWLVENLSCDANSCSGQIPWEVLNNPGTYKVTLNARTGQIDERDQPELVIPAPLRIFRLPPPIIIDELESDIVEKP